MDYIIDGYNLIGKIESIDLKQKNKEALLLEWLMDIPFQAKEKVIVVFDGKNEGFPYGSNEKKQGIYMMFTPPDQSADDCIKTMASKVKKPTTIISSDNDIAHAVQKNHLNRVLKAENFMISMKPKKKNRHEKPLQITENEVDFWLETWK